MIKNMFKDADFGDLYETRDGNMAVYLGPVEQFFDEKPLCHTLYINGTGWRDYDGDGLCRMGIPSDDIIGRRKTEDDECELHGWQMARIADCLKKCRRYINETQRNKRKTEKIEKLMGEISICNKFLKL